MTVHYRFYSILFFACKNELFGKVSKSEYSVSLDELELTLHDIHNTTHRSSLYSSFSTGAVKSVKASFTGSANLF